METILVRGVEYAADDPRRATHPTKPNGPLVPVPGTVVPLTQGGNGGMSAASSQQYIGHRREPIPRGKDGKIPLDAINDLGDVYTQADYPRGDDGLVRATIRPLTYRWVYDPDPVLVRKTPEILRALRRGEIVEVPMGETKKSKGGD
jgi:hypothetical protein